MFVDVIMYAKLPLKIVNDDNRFFVAIIIVFKKRSCDVYSSLEAFRCYKPNALPN